MVHKRSSLRALLKMSTRWQKMHETGSNAGSLVCCLGFLIILAGFVVMMVHSVPALIWHFVLAADLSFMFINESSRLLHLQCAAGGIVCFSAAFVDVCAQD